MTEKIYAPNVHLFAYHLYNQSNPPTLYEKCDAILEKFNITDFHLQQRIQLNKEPNRVRVDLLKEEEIERTQIVSPTFKGKVFLETKNLTFEGFAYPVRIHDTYALAFNIRRPEKENQQKTQDIDIALLEKFNPATCLQSDFLQSSLGQTTLITAWLTENNTQPTWKYRQLRAEGQKVIEDIANQCLTTFKKDPNIPKFYRQGRLFGSSIFEYRFFGQDGDYKQILVWLFASQETSDKVDKCYKYFIDLFLEFNKIRQAYSDSRTLANAIEHSYTEIEKEIDRFEGMVKDGFLTEDILKELQQQIKSFAKTSSEYTRLLRDLEEKRHTISISSRNYLTILNKIKQQIAEASDSDLSEDLSFLELSKRDFRQFQTQIKADLGYFVPGLGLLTQAIASIRGIVEIEQAKIERQREVDEKQWEEEEKLRDRQLQLTIFGVGSGIGAGGIVATSYAEVTKDDPLLPPLTSQKIHPFTLSVVYSIVFGVVVGTLILKAPEIWTWVRSFPKKK